MHPTLIETVNWELAERRVRPSEPVRIVKNAVVTQMRQTLVPAVPVEESGGSGIPHGLLSGAVYDNDGLLVELSQRQCGYGGDRQLQNDPPLLDQTDFQVERATKFKGTWLFGGHFFGHFGHFLLETLTNLWSDDPNIRGILFLPWTKSANSWQRELVARARDLPFYFVPEGGAIVDNLVVPGRSLILNHSVTDEACLAWKKIAVNPPRELSKKLFISRSKLNDGHRSFGNDFELDELALSLGFDVVHPQDLPISDQLQLVANAEILCGVSGSGLHLSAFGNQNLRMIEIGDKRTKTFPLPMQRIIDGSFGRFTAFIPAAQMENNLELRDMEFVRYSLTKLLDEK